MKKWLIIILGCLCIILMVTTIVLYKYNIIPHKSYDNAHFGITTYKSQVDKDKDGIDDQTDILENVRAYIDTKPKYKSKYYATGYSNDEYGVCTDVVANGLKGAGYDLMELVNEDILAHKELYQLEKPDKNIDFRRVKNLLVYFQNTAISLTTDLDEIDQWQGGDIVVFKKHIGIVSDKRNRAGVPFLIHHAYPSQFRYEEDVLGHNGEIIGHFRIS